MKIFRVIVLIVLAMSLIATMKPASADCIDAHESIVSTVRLITKFADDHHLTTAELYRTMRTTAGELIPLLQALEDCGSPGYSSLNSLYNWQLRSNDDVRLVDRVKQFRAQVGQ